MANLKQKPGVGSKAVKAAAPAKSSSASKAKTVAKPARAAPNVELKSTKKTAVSKAAVVKKAPVSVAKKAPVAVAKAAQKTTKAAAPKVTKPPTAPTSVVTTPVANASTVPVKPVDVVAKPATTSAPLPQQAIKPSVIESKTTKSAPATLKPSTTTAKDNGITMQDGRYALPTNARIELPEGYRPSSKEEYMSPPHLEFFRRKLQGWRADLVEESKQTIENLRDEVRDVGDEAERATRETENSLELRTRDRYRKLIAKIDKALKRIEEGRYGFCEETDEDIGLERLEARPIATLCLDAQERWEHRQKQMGD